MLNLVVDKIAMKLAYLTSSWSRRVCIIQYIAIGSVELNQESAHSSCQWCQCEYIQWVTEFKLFSKNSDTYLETCEYCMRTSNSLIRGNGFCRATIFFLPYTFHFLDSLPSCLHAVPNKNTDVIEAAYVTIFLLQAILTTMANMNI